jgi:hypothetical protein
MAEQWGQNNERPDQGEVYHSASIILPVCLFFLLERKLFAQERTERTEAMTTLRSLRGLLFKKCAQPAQTLIVCSAKAAKNGIPRTMSLLMTSA